jgi:hypothetical protein
MQARGVRIRYQIIFPRGQFFWQNKLLFFSIKKALTITLKIRKLQFSTLFCQLNYSRYFRSRRVKRVPQAQERCFSGLCETF